MPQLAEKVLLVLLVIAPPLLPTGREGGGEGGITQRAYSCVIALVHLHLPLILLLLLLCTCFTAPLPPPLPLLLA